MIDGKILVEDLKSARESLALKGFPAAEADKAARLIQEKNRLIQQTEKLKAEKNLLSRQITRLISEKDAGRANQVRQDSSQIKDQLKSLANQLKKLEEDLKTRLIKFPNFPSIKAPKGSGAKDNVETERAGPENFMQQVSPPHWEIGARLNILDQARASKISGSLFTVLRGPGAKLLRALIHFACQIYQSRYTEFIVPSLVNTKTFFGTGHLPKFAGESYHIPQDDLWAIPTGEVPLTALHRDEILPESSLPLKYMTYTPCFRREAGSAGQETRGLQRLHEFHKVELVKICRPEESEKELKSLLQDALKPIKALNLPYRVLDLCTGDLTWASARTYDIEVYAPGVKQWLEVSSVGLFTDYQMRRCRTRYRSGKKILFPHSLNGSGLATPRTLAALLENNFQPDGRVLIPKPLREFMGCTYIAPPRQAGFQSPVTSRDL